MFNINKLAIALTAVSGIVLSMPFEAIAATFQYTTISNKATFTARETTVAGLAYDGTFTNTIFNPFSRTEQTFSGFYQVQSGELGKAVSLNAVQQQPIDRTGLGNNEIARIEYLANPQQVSTVPNGFSVPPGLTEFDFKFVPATVAGAPIVLSNG